MRKYFTAAIYGTNRITKALRTTCASRFGHISAFVMIPSKSLKLTLQVTHHSREEADHVLLTVRDWRTGVTSILYDGILTGGTPKPHRLPRD